MYTGTFTADQNKKGNDNMASAADILDQTSEAEPTNNFAPRLGPGDHEAALVAADLKLVYDKKQQEKVWLVGLEWHIVQSNTHKPGERRSTAWKIGKAGNGGKNERARMNECAKAITESLGAKVDESKGAEGIKEFTKQVRVNMDKLLEVDPSTGTTKTAGRRFPGRGVTLRVRGVENKYTPQGTTQEVSFTNYTWTPKPNTPDGIKAMRTAIESAPIAQAEPAPATNAAPTSTPASAATTTAQTSKPAEQKPEPAAAPSMLDDIM